MIMWSLIVAALGLCGAGALVARTKNRWPHWGPERFWLLGMGALAPAWLIAFLGLLAPLPTPVSKGVVVGSSAVPFLGVIATDAVVRRLRQSGRDYRSVIYWLLGVAAILPGWGMALLVLIGAS